MRSDGYLRKFTPGGKHDTEADVIVFGHTHVPFHRELDAVHFVNTGSVGRQKTATTAPATTAPATTAPATVAS